MHSVRGGLAVAAAAGLLMAGGIAARAMSGPGAEPASARQGSPLVVVEPAVPQALVKTATVSQPRVVPAADATGWPGPPAAFNLPETPQASCESQRVPHPPSFFVMRSSGTDDLGAHGTHATYADHVSVETVCDNATQAGDLALELDIYAYGGDASHFALTVGPSGLVVVSAVPGHGAETIAAGRRIAAYPGGCGTLSMPDAGSTHASLDDTLCFDRTGHLTHAELHERSTLADGDTRQFDATFDPSS